MVGLLLVPPPLPRSHVKFVYTTSNICRRSRARTCAPTSRWRARIFAVPVVRLFSPFHRSRFLYVCKKVDDLGLEIRVDVMAKPFLMYHRLKRNWSISIPEQSSQSSLTRTTEQMTALEEASYPPPPTVTSTTLIVRLVYSEVLLFGANMPIVTMWLLSL